jgi:DNA polymerase
MNILERDIVADAAVTHVVHWDIESRSELKLDKVGTHKYARHPSTQILCVCYAVDDGPVQIWLPGDPIPPEFPEIAQNPNWFLCSHNAQFELALLRHILQPRYGWPRIPLARFRCTMAAGLASALPGRLELIAEALELLQQKDRAGRRLMLMVTKPRRARVAQGEDPDQIYWFDDPDRLSRLQEYCEQDVEVERDLCGQLPPLSLQELKLWQLDAIINARGFHFDRTLALAARKIAQALGPELNAELGQITDGAVTSLHQVARLKEWLAVQGYETKTLNKAAIEDLLGSEELPATVRRVLELRQGGAQAAARKIDAFLARCDEDGRIRGCLQYHAASTGRWGGRGVQPQNLKRPITEDIDAAVAAISTGDLQHVKKLYPQPLAIIGDISRSLITAAPGHILYGGDFSSIESRVLAWIAGEDWKLDSYRRFDATQDPHDEPYCVTACKLFRVPDGTYDKNSPERKVGKTCDLAFGYQGGLNAWRKFEPDRFSDEEVEQFKIEWRAAHPAIKKFWYAIDLATWHAVHHREKVIRCGRLLIKCTGMFLFIKLPSGRKLAYPYPRIEIEDLQHQVVVFKDASSGQWRDCRNGNGAYGGLWVENIVSGIARDILASALLRLEHNKYRVVLHVHDEAICEVPIGFGSTEEFTKLMIRPPSWALGLPIAANAWSGPRFSKS